MFALLGLVPALRIRNPFVCLTETLGAPDTACHGTSSTSTNDHAMNNRTPYEDLPEYLTPAELQTYLGLSRNTVYELLRRGEIEHRRFGRAIRIPKTALRQTNQR